MSPKIKSVLSTIATFKILFTVIIYKFMLEPTDDWQEYEFQLSELKEYQMGKQTGNSLTKAQLADIIRVGFIMSNKTDGPFKWEIDYIRFE